MKKIIYYCLGSFVLMYSACVPYESLLNYEQGVPGGAGRESIKNYQPLRIQTNDILYIRVGSRNESASQPFQAPSSGLSGGAGGGQNLLMSGYLVSQQGTINFPTLGTISLGGLTLTEARDTLLSRLRPYFLEAPMVDVRLLNFDISVNGEVASPGTFTIPDERITALEAITLAGDFTSYSLRDSVMVIREIDGERTFAYLNFDSPEVFRSPYFYLQQNDVLYVRPLRRKALTVQDPLRRALTYVSAATGVATLIVIISRNR